MDVMPSAALSVVMGVAVWFVGRLMPGVNVWLTLVVQIGCGVAVYAGLAWVFKMESFTYLKGMVMRR